MKLGNFVLFFRHICPPPFFPIPYPFRRLLRRLHISVRTKEMWQSEELKKDSRVMRQAAPGPVALGRGEGYGEGNRGGITEEE